MGELRRVGVAGAALLSVLWVGCSDSQSGRDGGDPDPAPYAPVVWERLVLEGGTLTLRGAVMLPSGVVLLSTPELPLYDRDGNEAGRAVWPGSGSFGWQVEGALSRSSGDLAVLFKHGGVLRVREYAGTDLAEGSLTEVGTLVEDGAIAESEGALYVLSRAEYVTELHRIEGGSVVDTRILSTPAGDLYIPDAEGYATTDGHLVFCVVHAAPEAIVPKILRIDPTTGATTELTLSDTGMTAEDGCRLVRGPDNLLAIWVDGPGVRHRWALVALDGTSVVAGPIDGLEEDPSGYQPFSHLTHDGLQFLAIADWGEAIHVIPIDDRSGELKPRWQVRLQEGEYVMSLALAIASDGANAYVGLTPKFPMEPEQLRLQKLAPLTPQSRRK